MPILILGKRRVGERRWIPWMTRAIEGHTMSGASSEAISHVVIEPDLSLMPAMCHGAKTSWTLPTLYSGFTSGRYSLMFSISHIGIEESE